MSYLNNIDWSAALSGAITFLIVFTIKQLLDLKLAHWWIKYGEVCRGVLR